MFEFCLNSNRLLMSYQYLSITVYKQNGAKVSMHAIIN